MFSIRNASLLEVLKKLDRTFGPELILNTYGAVMDERGREERSSRISKDADAALSEIQEILETAADEVHDPEQDYIEDMGAWNPDIQQDFDRDHDEDDD